MIRFDRVSGVLLVTAFAAVTALGKDVYLLLGQSNMAGRGYLEYDSRISTERVEKLDKTDHWVEGTEPLHFDKPSAGGGLGASFARVVADHDPSVTVGLVPCAVGGSALDEWMPGAKLYVEAMRRAKIAQKAGAIKAILWHQGESDADRGKKQSTYNERLTKMVAAMRAELGLEAAKVPFLYAAIGEFPTAPYYPGNKALNAVMRHAVETIPNSVWIEASDLQANGDQIHFDLQSVRTLGARYARAYLRLVKKEPVFLRNTYSDHMLFQRDQPIVIAGFAAPGVKVSVAMAGKTSVAVAGTNGQWKAELPALKAGGPYELTVKTADDARTLKDILIGELWLCSGQSNMEMPVWGPNSAYRLPDGEKVAAAAHDAELRLLRIPTALCPFGPCDEPLGHAGWNRADSANAVMPFSAVGYYHGVWLRKQLGVPVGLVQAAWGGTRIEPWIPEKALRAAKLTRAVEDFEYARDDQPVVNGKPQIPNSVRRKFLELQKWETVIDVQGRKPMAEWRNEARAPRTDDSGWSWNKGLWVNEPQWIWFRWHFNVERDNLDADMDEDQVVDVDLQDGGNPLPQNLKELAFEADFISDTDEAYLNGGLIGKTTIATMYHWGVKRHYKIGTLKSGSHVLAIRVRNHFGDGGIKNPRLVWKGGALDLATCKYCSKPEIVLSGENLKRFGQRPESPWGSDFTRLDPRFVNTVPTTLYNRMIAPLDTFRFRGAVWYQGCANTGAADWPLYDACQRALVAGWRETFARPDFAFVCVQLAGYWMHRLGQHEAMLKEALAKPVENGYVMIRPEQEKIRTLAGCGCATAIDIGMAEDIHPKDKNEVGRRLAACAQNLCYGGKRPVEGPKCVKAVRDGSAVLVTFDGPVVVKDGAFGDYEFTLAGADKNRVWAKAKLVKPETVRVEAAEVGEPVRVDYAWVPYAPKLSVYNAEGFPATPFFREVEK